MEYREEKEKELKETLDLVKEKFPEIKVDVEYECVDEPSKSPLCVKVYTTRLTSFYGNHIQTFKESYLKRITICASDSYFMFPFEEKLGGIAHELGHIMHDTKSLNPQRLYRDDEWSKELLNLSILSDHKANRLKKWALLREIHADTQAANKGYGECLLNVLKRLKPSVENDARIRNLEKMLKS